VQITVFACNMSPTHLIGETEQAPDETVAPASHCPPDGGGRSSKGHAHPMYNSFLDAIAREDRGGPKIKRRQHGLNRVKGLESSFRLSWGLKLPIQW
jgi:hypothetical protein